MGVVIQLTADSMEIAGNMGKLVGAVSRGLQMELLIQWPDEPWLLLCTRAAHPPDPTWQLARLLLSDPEGSHLLATAPQIHC